MDKKIKLEKGITLIALVITIIVLLILAGVSISMLTGENGLLTKATSAKETTERAEIIENIQLDILGKQVENQNGDITQTDLEEILTDYVKDSTTDIVKNDDGTIKEIVTKKGNYTIALSEIWSGEIKSSDDEETTYAAYSIGQEVTIKGTTESFYVLKASSEEESTVTLLAKYNLNKAGTEQAVNADSEDTAVAFSSAADEDGNSLWASETLSISSPYFNLNEYKAVQDDETSAVYKANSYATSEKIGAIGGRLMTYEEVYSLKDRYGDMIYGQANIQSNGNYLRYWLGSAEWTMTVKVVSGNVEGGLYSFSYGNTTYNRGETSYNNL